MGQPTLVDTFLFSEPHELEILLAKLHTEGKIVDHWIAVENKFTTKGHPKKANLWELIESDSRFRSFLDRMTVLTLDRAFVLDYKPSRLQWLTAFFHRLLHSRGLKHHRERRYFFAEKAQREAATDLALELARENGWIMVSDVDEMLDGSTPWRRTALSRSMESNAVIIHIPRRRFVFDFDNVSMARFRHTPLISARALRAQDYDLGELRFGRVGVPASPEPLVFEYSYCYDRERIHRKLATFAHVHPGREAVDRALRYNHALTTQPPHLMKNDCWFETIASDEARHPSYILDNMEALKTHSINPGYRDARRRDYPTFFQSAPQVP